MNIAHTPRAVADQFYTALARRDYASMGALYDDAATFTDPAFGTLDAHAARAMWKMLLSRSKDIAATHDILSADENVARTRWVARYTFTRTGRSVTNIIVGTMDIRNGKIIRHVDDFDLQAWMRQALGLPAVLLGWLPSFRAKVTSGAQAQLKDFMAKEKGA